MNYSLFYMVSVNLDKKILWLNYLKSYTSIYFLMVYYSGTLWTIHCFIWLVSYCCERRSEKGITNNNIRLFSVRMGNTHKEVNHVWCKAGCTWEIMQYYICWLRLHLILVHGTWSLLINFRQNAHTNLYSLPRPISNFSTPSHSPSVYTLGHWIRDAMKTGYGDYPCICISDSVWLRDGI